MSDAINEAAIRSHAKLGVGIVGLGLAGGVMASAIKDCPGFEIRGAVEPHADVRDQFTRTEGAPAFTALHELLARADIDIVYVATPHQFHREHAIASMAAGKHVIVEKPMALTASDCDAMIAAAGLHNVHLIVGHTHSFDPVVLAMRTLIEGGAVGALSSIAMWNYTDFLYRPRRPEELDTSQGGGILFNQVPHQVDIARLLAGSPVRSVRASTSTLDPARPTEGGCQVFLDFESGASASIVYSGYDRFDSDELHGWVSEGGYDKSAAHGRTRSRLSDIASAEQESNRRRTELGYGAAISAGRPPHQPHFGLLMASCNQADLRQSPNGYWRYDRDGAQEVPVAQHAWRPGRGDVLQEMRRAILDGMPPIHDGTFGRDTVGTSLAILKSARERREIVLGAETL